ncbi:MAG: hypothetical protein ACE5E9_05705 [Nitrospinaceae bacterium]
MWKIDEKTRIHLRALARMASEKDAEVFVVGGTLRDFLRGKKCSDYDLTARGVLKLARKFASQTQLPCACLDNTPGRETLRVVVRNQYHFDFTEMQGNSIEEDLGQRDFTFNAIAIPLDDFLEGRENLIDPHHGRIDLAQGIVRTVGEPVLAADPLRMLRAFRFAARFNFAIEPETLDKIVRGSARLDRVAAERVYYEMILFLGSEKVFDLLKLMDRTGLLDRVLPESGTLRETPVENTNAWDLGLKAVHELENLLACPETVASSHPLAKALPEKPRPLLKLAALLHRLDDCPQRDAGTGEPQPTFLSKTVPVLKRLRASNADIQFVSRTLQCHREAMATRLRFAGVEADDSHIYQFVKRCGGELIPGLFLACAVEEAQAKIFGRGSDPFLQAVRQILDFYFLRFLPAMEQRELLSGKDLIQKFHLPPSPLFRTILDRVEEARVLGTIKTKNDAERAAKHIIETQ